MTPIAALSAGLLAVTLAACAPSGPPGSPQAAHDAGCAAGRGAVGMQANDATPPAGSTPEYASAWLNGYETCQQVARQQNLLRGGG